MSSTSRKRIVAASHRPVEAGAGRDHPGRLVRWELHDHVAVGGFPLLDLVGPTRRVRGELHHLPTLHGLGHHRLDLLAWNLPARTGVGGPFPDLDHEQVAVQGEADEVCPLEALWQFYGRLHEPKEIAVIDAANHLFDGKATEVGEALEDLLSDY